MGQKKSKIMLTQYIDGPKTQSKLMVTVGVEVSGTYQSLEFFSEEEILEDQDFITFF